MPARLLQDLGERPVGDAVAVREAAPDEDPRALEPREQLAHEPALADAGVAVDRDELRALLGDDALLQREQEVELAVAADERRVHPRQPARLGVRRLTEQQEGAHGLLPAAQLLLTEVVEDEPGSGAGGALGDDRLAGLGELLEPGGGVDGDAGDDRLAGRRIERRDGLAGVDPGADLHGDPVRPLEARVQLDEPVANRERRAKRAGGIVLVRVRHAEHRHHRVADVLLDGPALRLDLAAHGGEPLAHHVTQLLDVEPVGKLRRARHVCEEHGHDLALARGGGGGHELIVRTPAPGF